MRFERQNVTTTRDEKLDEIVTLFTPSMQRVCGFIRPAELEAMIERMARNHLAGRPLAVAHLRPALGTRRPARDGAAAFQRTTPPTS